MNTISPLKFRDHVDISLSKHTYSKQSSNFLQHGINDKAPLACQEHFRLVIDSQRLLLHYSNMEENSKVFTIDYL